MRALVIENEIVVNFIEVEDLDFPVERGQFLVSSNEGGVGWSYRDGALRPPEVEPEPPEILVPAVVSRFQARMALREAGLFERAVALMSLPDTPIAVVEAWDSAQEFRRESENVRTMASALGLSESKLDDLFVAASGIQA